MRYTLFTMMILAAFVIYPALAGDVTLKTSQSEYTFPAGEEARVPFVVESSFPKTNVGTLEYSLTRKESQGGFSFSQSSSQSQSFPISPGSSQNAITLNSDDPTEYEVNLFLHFRDSGKDFVSTLPSFTVKFISNQTTQSQGSGPVGSQNSPLTSMTSETKQGGQSQGNDPFAEMDQRMNAMQQQNQQLLQQAMSGQGMSSGSGRQAQSQNPQEALQNNQMNAQSSALQQQLAQETTQNKKDQQELTQQMSQDPMLNQMSQDLNKAGYQQKDRSVSAQGKGSGQVSAQYANQNGQSVSLQGEVQNGSVQQLTATSNQSLPIPQTLSDDTRYQKEQNALQNTGFNQTGGTQVVTGNQTKVDEQYSTPDGKNATISSIIQNGTLQSVTVTKNDEIPVGWYIGIVLFIILICLCSWAAYQYYQKRNLLPEEEETDVLPEPLDIRTLTEGYLTRAEVAVKEGNLKDAYVQAGQALRFFISHTQGNGTADTTEEILELIRNNGMKAGIIDSILDQCMMVEFARREGTSNEVSDMITTIRSLVTERFPDEPIE